MAVPVRQVKLASLPIALFRESDEQVQSMLAAAEQAVVEGEQNLTASLALVVRTLTEEYSDLSTAAWADVEAAEAEGRTSLDLRLEGPVTLASACETWLRLLEHLEDLRASGMFEHAPTPERVQHFRRWLVDEIAAQMRDDRSPSPYVSA